MGRFRRRAPAARLLPLRGYRPFLERLEDRTLPSTAGLTPNDPSYGSLWALNNTGQSGGTVGADIGAPQAWATTTGNYATVVAIMDTGIDYDHPDLYENIWINQAEIPKSRLKNLIDVDGDGIITFRDLNDPRNQGPGKITDVNHDGRIDAADILAPMILNAQGQDTGLGGWADGSTQDGDTAHPDDLIGWNFINNTNNPFDDNGHGTHVAGTIGAMGNNDGGVVGINWQIQLMAVKFLNSSGGGSVEPAEALNYAVRHGAVVVNNSWATPGFDSTFYAAIAAAQSAGVIVVAAADNGGNNDDATPAYPACYQLNNVVSVAATDRHDQLASFSNYGPTSVDLAAPGEDILSTYPNGEYKTLSGTSMAAPQVTGVIALVRGLHPSWTYLQVIDQVLRTVDPLPSLKGKVETGGRLDAARAVNDVSGQPVTIDPNVAYVNQVFQDLLNRRADPGGLNFWVGELDNGLARSQMAQLIWESAEHRGLEVDQYFTTYLHRKADPVGRAAWVNVFLGGVGEAEVILDFVTSAEYQAVHATNQTFLQGLYKDVLGRTADAGGLASFGQAMQQGMTRTQAAQAILSSGEEAQHVVQGYYVSFLHRNLDPAGTAGWVGVITSGQESWMQVGTLLLSSAEFGALALKEN